MPIKPQEQKLPLDLMGLFFTACGIVFLALGLALILTTINFRIELAKNNVRFESAMRRLDLEYQYGQLIHSGTKTIKCGNYDVPVANLARPNPWYKDGEKISLPGDPDAKKHAIRYGYTNY